MFRETSGTSKGKRCMDLGTLWPSVWAFTDYLTALGYTHKSVIPCLSAARHFAVWLANSSIAPSEINASIVEQFFHHRCQCPRRRAAHMSASSIGRTHQFLRFLVENGVLPTSILPATPSTEPTDERITEFLDWLRHHRGLAEATITGYNRELKVLLPALGPDPATYDVGLVRNVILKEAETRQSYDIKHITKTLRGYLRFLVARGMCRPGLDQAVPTIAHWRLSALPLYLPAVQVETLIASCNQITPVGLRDRAILLLLARLGLRAGDIVVMRLCDIDWDAGTLRICGKGRREIQLPLPQDAGDALLLYLTQARPNSISTFVFLCSIAPFQPFADSSCVSTVVSSALKRAGITDAPSHGANLLRHSAATAWLRAGSTLDAIGTILRHRSADTTAHYAKVDITALQRVVQPWPGERLC